MTEKEIIQRQRENGGKEFYLMLIGQFFHAYETGAMVLAHVTGYRLVRKHRRMGDILTCGFPASQLEKVRERLAEQGGRMKDEGHLHVFTVPEGLTTSVFLSEPPLTLPSKGGEYKEWKEENSQLYVTSFHDFCHDSAKSSELDSALAAPKIQLEREFLSFDVANHTPMECMNFLCEMQKRMRGKD